MLSRTAAALVATLAACTADGRDPGNSIDASVIQADGPAPVCYPSSTEVEVALQIQIEESCAIWNSLSLLSGKATVSRSGANLTIDFGDGVVFTGPVTSGVVDLVYTHQHTFTDGCGWKATETLTGQLDPVGCNFVLDYDYAESVMVSNGHCAMPCAANADVTLQLTPIIL